MALAVFRRTHRQVQQIGIKSQYWENSVSYFRSVRNAVGKLLFFQGTGALIRCKIKTTANITLQNITDMPD